MGISERKEREKTEMRKRIVDAAVQMFKEEGPEKVSIRNIAEKIEYSPATLYLYYKDKDQLLLDAQADAFQQLGAAFRQIKFSSKPFKRLEQIMDAYIAFARTEPELYDLMFIMKAPMNAVENPECWDNGDESFDILRNCIQDCIDDGSIRFTDATTGAISVWGFAHGLISLDLKCRFKPALLRLEAVEEVVKSAIKAYLKQLHS